MSVQPRILLVTHYFPAHGGGVEMVAGAVAQRLAAAGWSIAWFASDTDAVPDLAGVAIRPQPAFNGFERALGVPVPIWSAPAFLRLLRAVRSADVVHIHDAQYPANFLAALGARCMGKRLIVTQHVGFVPYRNPLLRFLLSVTNRVVSRMVLAPAHATLFVSPLVRAYFESFLGSRLTFHDVPNGVDTSLFSPVPNSHRNEIRVRLALDERQPVMLFVGRHVEKKGLGLIRELASSTPEWVWCLIGDGPIDPSSWALSNVRSLGRVPQKEIVDYYRVADALVLPSVGEGFPLVVQEALSCGLPVVVHTETRDSGALPETVCVAESVVGSDVAARWQHRLTSILASDMTAQQARRDACRAFAIEKWSWQATVDRYANALAGTRH